MKNEARFNEVTEKLNKIQKRKKIVLDYEARTCQTATNFDTRENI